MTQAGERRGTRAERLAMPLARNVVKGLAVEHGACIRPIQLRCTDVTTGAVEQVLVPCGHTLASVCPPCAERAKALRAAQCREGWHLEDEPVMEPDQPTDEQRARITDRAEAQADRDALAAEGLDTTGLGERIGELDQQITEAGMRGRVLPARPRHHRSTRRRQDAAPLPRRRVSNRTVGKTYTAPDGKVFRPSLFVTLTCPSYGKVTSDGTPADPGTYDYTRAGPGGFSDTGGGAQVDADVCKPAAYPARRQRAAVRGPGFPGVAQVRGERAGEQELGEGGHDQADPPVGLLGSADPGGGQAQCALGELECSPGVEAAGDR